MINLDFDNELTQLNFTLESIFGPTKLVLKAKRLNYFTVQDVIKDKEAVNYYKNTRNQIVFTFLDNIIKYIDRVTISDNCFSKSDELEKNYSEILGLIDLLKDYNLASVIKLNKDYQIASFNLEELKEIYESNYLDYLDRINIELLFKFFCKNINNPSLILSQLDKHKAATNEEELLKELENKVYSLDSKSKDIIIRRFVRNETLEFIAKDYNVTRERIRQIESKALEKLNFTLDKYGKDIFNIIGDTYILHGNLLDYVIEHFEQKGLYKIYIDSKTRLKIGIKSVIYKEVLNQIKLLEVQIENKVAIDLSDINLDLSDQFINKYLITFHDYKNGYIDKKVTITDALSEIMKNYDKDINLKNDSDIDFILNELKNKYKIDLASESSGYVRNIERAISVNCLLVGAHTFRHKEKIKKINNELIANITRFLKTQKITTGKAIYSTFGSSLREFDISSPQAIYSYFRYFFPKDFDYGGVSLAISTRTTKSSFTELIKELILFEKRPINKTEILIKYPAITNTIVNNLTLNDKSFAYWGNNNYYLKELIKLNEKTKNEIWKTLKTSKIIKTTILIDKIKQIDNKILDKNFIYNEDSLFFFLKSVYGDKVRKKEGYRIIYLV
jgi:RNA polymerase sigma factor (sigma-70 family)